MENKEITVRKIPLKIFLNTLENLYEQGIDFIDLISITSEKQDTIKIDIKMEYVNEDYEVVEDTIETRKLTEEDFNQIM